MKNRRNYYRVLHVQPDVPIEIIRASYRTLMHALKMHPDLGGDHWNAAILNEAFATIGDPEKRAAYDKTLKSFREQLRRQSQSPPAGHAPPRTDCTRVPAGANCAFCGKPHPAQAAESPEALCDGCRSPLVPVARHAGLTGTRRMLERLPRRMRVTCVEAGRPDERLEMTTENISINGMLLTGRRELSPGQRLMIQCNFCDAVGVVTHVSVDDSGWAPRWSAGVQFLTLRFKKIRGVFLSLEG